MKWEFACRITRVRILALREQSRAGGPPTAGQLRRALLPIAGDLLRAPWQELDDPAKRAEALRRCRRARRVELDLLGMGSSGGGRAVGSTVVRKGEPE